MLHTSSKKNKPNVGKYFSPMEHMAGVVITPNNSEQDAQISARGAYIPLKDNGGHESGWFNHGTWMSIPIEFQWSSIK